MNFVLILVLPLVFLLYSFSLKELKGNFSAFLLGIVSGILSLIILSFFPFSSLQISAIFTVHLWRFFLQYFFLNACFGLVFFFLISFSISEETLSSSLSALFGIFTSVFVYLFYKNINIPDSTELILFLLIIIGAILIFDFIFYILYANLTIASDFIIYLLAFVSFIIFMFIGSYALSCWFFSEKSSMYIFMSCGICLIGCILNIVRNIIL